MDAEPISVIDCGVYNESGELKPVTLPVNGKSLYNSLKKANCIDGIGILRHLPCRFAYLIRKDVVNANEQYTLVYNNSGSIEKFYEFLEENSINSIITMDYISRKFWSTDLAGLKMLLNNIYEYAPG